MPNDAYKVKSDVSLPRAIREVEELAGGEKVYETVGVNYVAGTYVLASDIAPFVREKAENGDLDHLLEPVSREEAEEALNLVEYGTFIPEHEAERVILEDFGHQTVPREQVLELKSAGAGDASEALELAKSDGLDERPALKEPEVPSLAEVSRGEAENVATDVKRVSDEDLKGVEQPPGLPVGEDLAPKKPRGRPRKAEDKVAGKPAPTPAKPEGDTK